MFICSLYCLSMCVHACIHMCVHVHIYVCSGSHCSQMFCHQYLGCTKLGCLGCLSKFKGQSDNLSKNSSRRHNHELLFTIDMHLESTCLNGILGNAYESNILKSYLDNKNFSIDDFVHALCAWMGDGGRVTTSSSGQMPITPDTYICSGCALVALRQLAYHYRMTIPKEDLPSAVTSREDCYWGKECTTQFRTLAHAMYVHMYLLLTCVYLCAHVCVWVLISQSVSLHISNRTFAHLHFLPNDSPYLLLSQLIFTC